MPLLRYFALHTAYFDLGQYTTNYVMAVLDGHLEIIFRSHAHPVMLAVAPFFYAVPAVETLLVLQSLMLVAGIVLYGRLWQVLGDGTGVVGSALMAVSITVWSNDLFDYHFEHFLFVLYPLFFLRLEAKGRYCSVELIAIALAICCVKENYALTALGLGLYVAIARPQQRITGALIMVAAGAYFIAATMWIIPMFSEGRQSGDLWREAFSYLGNTPVEIAASVAQRPWVIVTETLSSTRKIIFLLAIVGPFAVTLWRAPLLLIPALPNLAIVLLSQSANHSYLANQYTAAVALPVLVAMAYAMAGRGFAADVAPASAGGAGSARLVREPFLALAFGGSVAVLLLFGLAPGSRLFLSPSAWSFNAAAYLPTARDAMVRKAIADHVPADRSIVVASQNVLHTGRLSLRTHSLPFPQSVFTPLSVLKSAALATHGSGAAPAAGAPPRRANAAEAAARGQVYADYVVLDLKRPWYIADRLAEPGTAQGDEFMTLVGQLGQEFTLAFESDRLQIWRRH